MYEIDHLDHLGHRITLHPDEHCDSPRDEENLTTLVMAHRRWDFPNEADVDFDAYDSWAAVAAHLTDHYNPVLLVPITMYDHSAVAFRVGTDFADVDPGQWDSGIVGIAMVTPERQAEYGTPDDRLLDAVKAEVEAFEAYVNGYVVGYRIDGPCTDDSCWGYYTWEDAYADAKAEIEAAARHHWQQAMAATAQAMVR